MKRKINVITIVFIFFIIFMMFYLKKEDESNVYIIDSNVRKMLEYMNVSECYVKELYDVNNVICEVKEKNIGEIELINYIREGYAEDLLNYISIKDDRAICTNDVICVKANVYSEKEVIIENDEFYIEVGCGFFGKEFEDKLIGKCIGEKYYIKSKCDRYAEYYDKYENLYLEVTILSIGFFEYREITDEWVILNTELNNVDEFKIKMYNDLDKKYKNEEREEIYKQLLEQMIFNSVFRLDNESVRKYSLDTIYGYEEIAYFYNMDLDTYIGSQLKLSENEFFEMCYNESKKNIQEFLIIGSMAKKNNITVEENEIILSLSIDGYEEDEIGRIMENDEKICYYIYQLLRNKVIDYLISQVNIRYI